LWSHYYDRMVRVARGRLGDKPHPALSSQDIVQIAFSEFCLQAEEGRFPELLDREGLWKLLVVIINRKAREQIRNQNRDKRGGQAGLGRLDESVADLDSALPDRAAAAPDANLLFQELLDRLPEKPAEVSLRDIALLALEGYTNEEIAAKLNSRLRTIERKLGIIRTIWGNEKP